jgi:hypothetical protein
MNLLSYPYRQSWRLLVLATVFGTISGLCGAGVVALIGKGVKGDGDIWLSGLAFFGLCALQLVTKSVSEIALLRSTQDAILQLRVDLSRKLPATPSRRLQELGKPGLLVNLTEDIDTFITAFQVLLSIFRNAIVIIACLGFMAPCRCSCSRSSPSAWWCAWSATTSWRRCRCAACSRCASRSTGSTRISAASSKAARTCSSMRSARTASSTT